MRRQRGNMHPMMAIALASVTVASGVIVAKQAGLIGAPAAPAAQVAPPVATPPAPTTAASSPAPERERPRRQESERPREQQRAPATNLAMNTATPPPPPPPPCMNCGVIAGIRARQINGGDSGMGAVGGAIAGGVLGHQIGNGQGKTVATVLGALGGMLAGNTVEERARTHTVYEVEVSMADGSMRQFRFPQPPGLSPGQPVMVENGQLIPR